jgi:catechol 2,3-dioxygenase-like lactoylglutathione lyase family enzyme
MGNNERSKRHKITEQKARITGLDHVCLRVKNLTESVKFYNEILGLPIVAIRGTKGNVFLGNRKFTGGFELVQRTEEEPPVLYHLSLEVENIEAVIESLKEKGICFTTPIRDLKFEDEKAAVKVAFFVDPDGIPFELVEWRRL